MRISTRFSAAHKPQLVQHQSVANVKALGAPPFVMTVEQMRQLGTHGLGTLRTPKGNVVGEVTMIDRVAYFSDIEGHTSVLDGREEVYFMQAVNFSSCMLHSGANIGGPDNASARTNLVGYTHMFMGGKPRPYAAVLTGKFTGLVLRSVNGEASRYTSLDQIVKDQKEFPVIDGAELTAFALYSGPNDVADSDTFPGLHIHAVSKSGRIGGHVLSMTGFEGRGLVMPLDVDQWLVSQSSAGGQQLYRQATRAGAAPVAATLEEVFALG